MHIAIGFALLSVMGCGAGSSSDDVAGDADADIDADADADSDCDAWCDVQIDCGTGMTAQNCPPACDCALGVMVREDLGPSFLACGVDPDCAAQEACLDELIAGAEPSPAAVQYLEICEARKPDCEGVVAWNCGEPAFWSDPYIAEMRTCFEDLPCDQILDCIQNGGSSLC